MGAIQGPIRRAASPPGGGGVARTEHRRVDWAVCCWRLLLVVDLCQIYCQRWRRHCLRMEEGSAQCAAGQRARRRLAHFTGRLRPREPVDGRAPAVQVELAPFATNTLHDETREPRDLIMFAPAREPAGVAQASKPVGFGLELWNIRARRRRGATFARRAAALCCTRSRARLSARSAFVAGSTEVPQQ